MRSLANSVFIVHGASESDTSEQLNTFTFDNICLHFIDFNIVSEEGPKVMPNAKGAHRREMSSAPGPLPPQRCHELDASLVSTLQVATRAK